MYKSVLIAVVSVLIHTISAELNLGEARIVSYQRCLLDADCFENSFCFDNDNHKIGRCKCVNGYYLLTRNRTFYACLKLANWDEPCVQDNQCYDYLGTNAVCDTTCKCGEGSNRYPFDGRCYRNVLLDDVCQTDANCLLKNGSYGSCTDGHCDCNLLQRPAEDRMSCVESRNIGDTCDNDEQCALIPNSLCRMVCRCAPGYVLSRNQRHCLKAATYFFEPCEENEQCSEYLIGSICNNGNCTCNEGFHGLGSRCARNVGLGEACTGYEECIPDVKFKDIVSCTEGICQCQPGVTDETFGCNSIQRSIVNNYIVSFCILYFFFK